MGKGYNPSYRGFSTSSKHRKALNGSTIRAKKMLSCEVCNFYEPYVAKNKLKTGSECPRCKQKTLRVFDSKAEFRRGQELKMLLQSGEINDLIFQPVFNLHAPTHTNPPVLTHIYDYVADFSYIDTKTNEYIVEDVKGSSRGKPIVTDVSGMKIRHTESEYGINIRIVMR